MWRPGGRAPNCPCSAGNSSTRRHLATVFGTARIYPHLPTCAGRILAYFLVALNFADFSHYHIPYKRNSASSWIHTVKSKNQPSSQSWQRYGCTSVRGKRNLNAGDYSFILNPKVKREEQNTFIVNMFMLTAYDWLKKKPYLTFLFIILIFRVFNYIFSVFHSTTLTSVFRNNKLLFLGQI